MLPPALRWQFLQIRLAMNIDKKQDDQSNFTEIARWMALPFVAMLVPCLFYYLLSSLLEMVGIDYRSIYFYMPMIFVQGALFVISGCAVAPNNKRTAGIMLISVVLAFSISIIMLSSSLYFSMILANLKLSILLNLLWAASIFQLSGAVYGYRRSRKYYLDKYEH
jgi:hypothetical protein